MVGAYLFGGVTILQFHLQGLGVPIASQLLSMLPYLATIVVLVLISRDAGWIRLNMPASLGKNFDRTMSERFHPDRLVDAGRRQYGVAPPCHGAA